MNVLVSLALADDLGLLQGGSVPRNARRTAVAPRQPEGDAMRLGTEIVTHLAQRVCELRIQVLDDRRDLALQLELVPLLEVQPWGVDDGQQEAVVLALADLYAGGLYALRLLWRTAQEALHRRFLVCGGGRRDVRGIQEQSEKRRLPGPLRASNLTIRYNSAGAPK